MRFVQHCRRKFAAGLEDFRWLAALLNLVWTPHRKQNFGKNSQTAAPFTTDTGSSRHTQNAFATPAPPGGAAGGSGTAAFSASSVPLASAHRGESSAPSSPSTSGSSAASSTSSKRFSRITALPHLTGSSRLSAKANRGPSAGPGGAGGFAAAPEDFEKTSASDGTASAALAQLLGAPEPGAAQLGGGSGSSSAVQLHHSTREQALREQIQLRAMQIFALLMWGAPGAAGPSSASGFFLQTALPRLKDSDTHVVARSRSKRGSSGASSLADEPGVSSKVLEASASQVLDSLEVLDEPPTGQVAHFK